jgi:uncharacterized membrane protein
MLHPSHVHPNNHPADDIAARLLGKPYDTLDERTRTVTRHVAARKHIARNVAKDFDAHPSFGQRAADRVAAFGGSWPFVGLFAGGVLVWVVLNGVLMLHQGHAFDPYPYILLNLFLSMLAAIQAPVILMSQNRQAEKDRISAEHDYEVKKMDALRQTQWSELLQIQREQMSLLATLAAGAAHPVMPIMPTAPTQAEPPQGVA